MQANARSVMFLAFLTAFILAGFSLVRADETGTSGEKPLWSLQPVSAPRPPRTPFDRLARNAIDRFLFHKLADKGLEPSPPATRLELLRRVTFDLTGLPPTPAEVERFLADASPDAYEKVVDRLLASPAYGERWARHWLDVVRFGESNGYEQNHLRLNAWPYRDYVIRAFNADKPFDEFVIEQLAGDAVGRGDPDSEAATGFLVAGIHDTVGNQTLEGTLQQRANDLEDIVATVGATFLGLTVGCARCHDHKFDPIPQKDYYRMAAVFAGVRHGERDVPARKSPGASRRSPGEIARRIHQLKDRIAALDDAARERVLARQGAGKPVPRPAVNPARNVDEFAPVAARFVRFTILATRSQDEPCLDELEVFGPDNEDNLALAKRGARASASSLLPGYAIHQVRHLNDGRFGNDFSWICKERAGWAQIELPAAARINKVVWSRDAGEPARFTDRLATVYRIDVSLDGNTWTTVATHAGRAPAPEAIPRPTLDAALAPEEYRQRQLCLEKLEDLRALLTDNKPGKAYAGLFTAPDTIYVLKRGDVMRKMGVALPGALSRVPGLPGKLLLQPGHGEPERRLALARWLVDRRNPLTPRVLVNRIWQYHFGVGIVSTPSDFGRNGAPSSHPELLDWLARDFMEHGWRLKYLHRLIVTSYAYRQCNAVRPAAARVDAGNRLLWAAPLRRLEAEALRDAMLQTAGNLDRKMGGPGYRLFKYHVINIGIYEPLEDFGPETWRRGIYATAARAVHDDLMGSFDGPECAQRTPRRDVTTTPLQALSLLNGRFATQQAECFARRVAHEAGRDHVARVDRAFRLALGRPPRDEERRRALDLVARHGLVSLCRALFNANEFLFY
jgi:hypothetical protein